MDKKTLIIVVLVFVGSFSVTYFLLKKDKPTSAFNIENYIPISNHGVVGAINYEAIESIVQKEMFRNPLELMDMKNNFKGNEFIGHLISSLIRGGIDKEQKIIFSLPHDYKKGSFVLIAIEDSARINESLTKQLGAYSSVKLNVEQTAFSNYYPKEQIGLVLNEHFLLIAFEDEKETAALWDGIINQTNCYSSEFKGIDSIINNEHHISLWTDKTSMISSIVSASEPKLDNEWFTHLDFLDGKLVVSASMLTDSTYFPNEITPSYTTDSSALSFHINMKNISDLTNNLDKSVSLKIDSIAELFNINYSEVLGLSNGKLDLNIIGKGIREDKIITYEFDDDFNKVKREKVITSPIVNFVMSIGNSNEQMYQYFKDHGVIKVNKGEEIFTNPIGKCYTQTSNTELVLVSNKELSIEKSKVDSSGFYFYADMDRIRLLLKKENKQLEVFESLLIKGNQNDKTITFKLELSSKNASKNILFDMFEAKMK